jgi:hypothetical protein
MNGAGHKTVFLFPEKSRDGKYFWGGLPNIKSHATFHSDIGFLRN